LVVSSMLLAAAFIAGCSGDDGAPEASLTASPSPTPAATPTPTEEVSETPAASPTATPPEALKGFAEFGGQIDQAVTDKSTAFFLTNPLLTDIECPNELMDQCGDGPTPTIISGILLGAWRSEAFPRTLNDFGISVGEYLAKGPRLRALAVDQSGGDTFFYAITAVDGDPESTAVFSYKEGTGTYQLYALIFAPSLGDEWLSGSCTDCYDQWMLWEGSGN
jgi:hypothetical protein